MPADNTLMLSLEFNATSKAYLDSIISSTALAGYQVRLQSTTGASAICTLNFAGYCMEPPEIFTDRDGVTTLEMRLQGTYSSALTNWFTATVVNAVSALP
jgi:predicted membrane GTPase involved in stress response